MSCSCPGYQHHYLLNDEADKHTLALATVGGATVLNTAVADESPTTDKPAEPETGADRLRADGGALHAEIEATYDKV